MKLSKIRVLHFIETLKIGGAEIRLVSDVRGLDTARFEHLLCYMYPVNELSREIQPDVKVKCLEMRGIYDFGRAYKGMKRIFDDFMPDIIHTHTFAPDIYGRLMGRLFSRACIVTTLHSMDYRKYISEDVIRYSYKRKAIDALTCSLTDVFIAVSEHIKNMAIKNLRVKKVEVIYNYPKDNMNSRRGGGAVLRRSLGLGDSFVIFSCGNLRPQKGHRFLISAMAEIIKRVPKAKLLIAGDGPFLPDLKEDIRRFNLGGTITLLGRRNDVPDLLSAADVFVFPSLEEGQGLALIEAMTAGLPCVASDIGPIREIIPNAETGILTKPGDAHAIADAILKLYSDRNMANVIAVAGRDYAVKTFNAVSSTEKLSRLYEELYEKNIAYCRG